MKVDGIQTSRPSSAGWISIALLMVSVGGAVAGSGVLTTLVPVRAAMEGFAYAVGPMGASYFAGMLVGAIVAPRIVRRFGSVPTYAVALVLAAAVLVAMPVWVNPVAWIVMRGLTGFSLAGLYAVVEAYLQAAAENRYRGRLLAVYSVMQYGGWAVGGQLMRVDDPAAAGIFHVAAVIVVAVGLMPLALVRRDPPRTVAPADALPLGMDLPGLWRISPVGFVAVILIGSVNGPFWTLTPVYADAIGLTPVAVGTLMTAVTVGAALFQFPVGRLSDAIDRRLVIAALALLAGAIEASLAFAGPALAGWPLIVLGFLVGGLIATQYYAASAHANDRAGPGRAVSIASALLFLYSVGAITGPLTGALAMELFGPGALHLHNLALHLALAGFVLHRARAAPAAPPRRRG